MKKVLSMTAGLSLLGSVAVAQEAVKNGEILPVYDYERPGLTAQGARVSAFIVQPQFQIESEYNDNVYATDGNEIDDIVMRYIPAIAAKTDWSRHSLGFRATAEIGRYFDQGAEDYEDFGLEATGSLDVTRDTKISGGVSFEDLHEDRASANDVNGNEPTEYDVLKGNVRADHVVGRVGVSLFADAADMDYDPVTGSGFNNDLRDRKVYNIGARGTYEFKPGYRGFVQSSYRSRDYDQTGAVNRDNDGYRVITGLDLDVSGKTRAEIFAGYLNHSYDDPTLTDVDAFSYGANVLWKPSQLTSVEFEMNRDVQETIVSNASAIIETEAAVEIQHELRRNLLLNGVLEYQIEDYDGGTTNREDDSVSVSLGADYFMNRNMSFQVTYSYTERDSNQAGEDYTQNIGLVNAKFTY